MSDVNKQIIEEIKKYAAVRCMNYSELADKLGVTKSAVSSAVAGRYNIGNKFKKALHDKCGFSMQFLATGEGPVYDSPITVTGNKVAIGENAAIDSHNVNSDPELVKRLLAKIDQLEAENRELREKYIKLLEKMALN